jgi:glycosyltransferase involved in cell wall biosynthesis
MRIAIDARMMGASQTRGIGRYIEEIIRAMIKIAPQNRYILLERAPKISPFFNPQIVEHLKANFHWYGWEEQIKLPRLIRRAKADVIFVPHWNISWFCRIPRVVFIHDLILLEEPASANVSTRDPLTRWVKRKAHRLVLRRALKTSRAILVPTQHIADRIKYYFPNIKTQVIVTGEGMPKVDCSLWKEADGGWQFEKTNPQTTPLIRSSRPVPYLLMVGSAYPHKNHIKVLEAWKVLSKKHPTLRLRIVGTEDLFMQRVMDRVRRAGIHQVDFLGRLTDAELDTVYAKAIGLIFASRSEGFGLPPLEAFAHGIPVLSSHASCMPEVLGDRGVIYFNPSEPDAIVKAVEDLLRNPGGVREEARKAVAQLQERHDWNISAERTIRVIEEVVS